jgi:hypothetical protein
VFSGKTFLSAEMVADPASLTTPSLTVTNDPKTSEEGISFSAVNFPVEGVILSMDAQMGNMDVMNLGSGMLIAVERSFGARMPIRIALSHAEAGSTFAEQEIQIDFKLIAMSTQT